MNLRLFHSLAIALTISTGIAAQSDSVKTMNQVVVTGTRNAVDTKHLPMTVTVVGRELLTENFQPSVLPTLVQRVPGLMITGRGMMGYGVSTYGSGGMNLRGISGGAGQMMVLIDGHPQYQGVYGHPIADSYQTLMAERVEVVRGPASVLYGSNAMGGVMNIVTRAFPAERDSVATRLIIGAGSHGTYQTEACNQMRHGRLTTTVAAQYNHSNNHRPRMGFEQYGGYAKVGYDINSHWNTYGDINVTHFNNSFPGSVTTPMYDLDQWITRGAASVVVENHYERTSGAISAYSNFGRHKIDDGTSDPTTPTQRYFRSRDNLSGFSLYQSARLFRGNRVTAGLDYQHIYGHAYYTSKATGETLDTPNKQSGKSHRNEVAVYLDFRQDVTQWLTLDAGIRLDHHSTTGTEWIPQTGIVLRPIQEGTLKLTACKGFRNPTMREMYLYPPSNTELAPERLWNYELAWQHTLGPVTYGANLFYLKGDNMIQTQMVDGKPRNVNTGKVENCGVEFELTYHAGTHWNLTTNHSWLHMEHKVLSAPTYKGFLGADMQYGRWGANAGLQFVAGLYTSVGTTETKEDFCLLNATVRYRVCRQATLWLRGENLLAQRYEYQLGYPMPRATVMGGASISF